MKRICINCKNEIEVKTLQTKYCPVCKILIWKKQKKIRMDQRYKTTRREYDLFCTKCFASLPTGSHLDKLYCEKCLKVHTRQRVAANTRKKRNGKKLDKFYKNLRINLIQTPYLIERRKIELLPRM